MQGVSNWRPALTVFLVLSMLDIASTWLGLSIGLSESNSLLAMVLAKAGEAAMFGAKAIMTLLVAVSVVRLSRYYPRLWGSVKFANLVLYVVVCLNLSQILAA